MLRQRIRTAIVLAAGLLGALFGLPAATFSLLMAAVLAVAAWEWGRLAGLAGRAAQFGYVAVVLALVTIVASLHQDMPGATTALLALAGGGWLLALHWICRYPASVSRWGGVGACLAMGAGVLVPTWAAIHVLVHRDPWLVVWVIAVVAAADIGAYFCGRRFGRHRLAPAVSPGKTWEGLVGGQLSVLLVVAVGGGYLGLAGQRWAAWLLLGLLTGLASVAGDLLESMVKRHRGVKDSGHLLPGHGGVLDRIDGLTAALPVFALSLSLLDPDL